MNALPLRLRPGDDLREAVEARLAVHDTTAAFVVAGIGSLSCALIRFAGADTATRIDGELEILTLSGSIAPTGSHLHVGLADASGRVFGGHVACGCIVRTTAEILIALLPDWHFARTADPATGFDELVVRPSSNGTS